LLVEALLLAAEIVAAAKGSVTFEANAGHTKQPKGIVDWEERGRDSIYVYMLFTLLYASSCFRHNVSKAHFCSLSICNVIQGFQQQAQLPLSAVWE